MTESAATRAALLARPGEACDRLAAALREAGADVVLIGDPRSLDPDALRACAPQALLVALEPAVEDSLDRFASVLHDPSLMVIFDEAELAARREGWDAARWTRHLRAKLHGHDDVLPPGAAMAEVVTDFADGDGDGVDATVLAMLATLDAPSPTASAEAIHDTPSRDAATDTDVRLDDSPLELEWTADGDASASGTASGIVLVGAGELLDSLAEPGSVRGDDASSAVVDSTPLVLDWSADRDDGDLDDSVGAGTLSLVDAGELLDSLGSTDAVAASFDGTALDPDMQALLDSLADDTGDAEDSDATPAPIDAPSLEADVQAMLDSADDDRDSASLELSADGDSASADVSAPSAPADPARAAPLFDAAHMRLDAMADGDDAADDTASAGGTATDAAHAADAVVRAEPDFSRFDIGLSLADDDAGPLGAIPADVDAPGARATVDLDALERRAAALSLVEADDDDVAPGMPDDAPWRGAVVVEAGLGGPDAVRQLLGGLPSSFPRPVLVRLQLDGGRYDRLVKQMARASSLPVAIAEDGGYARAGTVYFLPDGVALVQREAGLGFAAHDDAATWMDALPAADTALLLLSGSDVARVDAAMALSAGGALVAGQSADNCYDGRASGALIQQGAVAGTPAELAARLVARWPS